MENRTAGVSLIVKSTSDDIFTIKPRDFHYQLTIDSRPMPMYCLCARVLLIKRVTLYYQILEHFHCTVDSTGRFQRRKMACIVVQCDAIRWEQLEKSTLFERL